MNRRGQRHFDYGKAMREKRESVLAALQADEQLGPWLSATERNRLTLARLIVAEVIGAKTREEI